MGDAAQLLGISKTDLEAARAEADEKKGSKQKKRPKGLSKEVFQLLRPQELKELENAATAFDGEPDLFSRSYLKKLAGKKVRKWKWAEFQNPVRVDDLRLSHWDRQEEVKIIENTESQSDIKAYPFEKFNRATFPPELLKTNLENYKKSSNSPWELSELKFLMFLAQKFNLNWYTMYDKWIEVDIRYLFKLTAKISVPKDSKRDLVEIKTEFFRISKNYFSSQAMEIDSKDVSYHSKLSEKCIIKKKVIENLKEFVSSTETDPIAESMRIKMLDEQHKRTRDDFEQELKVIEDINEIDRKIDKIMKEIQALKRAKGLDDEVTLEFVKRHSTLVELFLQQNNQLTSDAVLEKIHSKKKKFRLRTGVCFRSTTLVAPPSEVGIGPKLVEKVTKILDELNITRRIIANEKLSKEYNGLRLNILKLIILSKELSRLEAEKEG